MNSGTYALQLTNTSGQYGFVETTLGGGSESLTYTRLDFRPPSPAVTATLAEGRDANNNVLWVVSYDAGRQGLDVYFWMGAHARPPL